MFLVPYHIIWMGYCVQVVVFALGIGTRMQHAEQLIAAFKVLCEQYQTAQSPPATVPQHAALGKLQLIPSLNHQQLTLREAFFASTTR